MNHLIIASSDVSTIEYIFYSNIINWFLVVLFVVWLLKKFNVLSHIANIQQRIVDKIKSSEDEKKEKELLLYETTDKVRNTDKEADEIIKEAKDFAKKLSSDIISDAESDVQEHNKKIDNIIDVEKSVAKNELKSEISKAALIIAEEHIKQALDEELHNKFINEFINDLDKVKV